MFFITQCAQADETGDRIIPGTKLCLLAIKREHVTEMHSPTQHMKALSTKVHSFTLITYTNFFCNLPEDTISPKVVSILPRKSCWEKAQKNNEETAKNMENTKLRK